MRAAGAEGALRPTRIVSLTLATDEVLLALVSPRRIAALSELADDRRFSNVGAEARAVRGRASGASAELIVAASPDLVLLAAYTDAATRELLRAVGITLVELRLYGSIAQIEDNILTIGRAVGAPERARSLVHDMERRLSELRGRLRSLGRPRVLYCGRGGFTAGAETSIGEIITLAGGENVATRAGVRGFEKLSREMLVVLDPEVILVSSTGEERRGLKDLLLADPVLKPVAAVRAGRVYALPHSYLNTLSHHIVRAVEATARLLHPEAFAGEAG
jgi:iron complex transport system substrate-binding protein